MNYNHYNQYSEVHVCSICDTPTLVQDSMLCIVTFLLNMMPLLCWAKSSNVLIQSTAIAEARLVQLTADSIAAVR